MTEQLENDLILVCRSCHSCIYIEKNVDNEMIDCTNAMHKEEWDYTWFSRAENIIINCRFHVALSEINGGDANG